MYRLLFVIFISFISTNYCIANDYQNPDLGIELLIPDGAKVTEGNRLKSFSNVEIAAFKKVFETDPGSIQDALNKTIFTIGYYDGPISEGPNGSLVVSAVPAMTNDIKVFLSSLLGAEEKETESMSFRFSEQGTDLKISGRNFVVSKGKLKIIQNQVPIFEMPIYYYITEIDSKFVSFTISGNAERVASLEKSLLAMVINE